MSIATKTGDRGTTSLFGGERVKKDDKRIHAFGAIDELNAAIGVANIYVKDQEIKKNLEIIQHNLFRIGAELSALTTKKLSVEMPTINENHVKFLDEQVKEQENKLKPMTAFILPGGNQAAAHLHHARTICRRAEINTVALEGVKPQTLQYLNRLSDVIFLYARTENEGKDVTLDYDKHTNR